jgi:hypothetical protein
LQFFAYLARWDPANDSPAFDLHRALSPVTQLNMDMGKQVVTGVHYHARCREFMQDRHERMLVQ